jgi:hypothetical protein
LIIEPSESVPTAVKGCVANLAMVADGGLTVIELSVALDTVTASVPVTPW